MPAIIAFVNQKGGSGKSKAVLGVAPELAELGRRVLCVDADPQATLTNALLGRGHDLAGVAEVLGVGKIAEEQRLAIDDVVVSAEGFGIDVLASNLHRLGLAETELSADSTRVVDLNYAIASITRPYDYILIDTPGSLGPMTMAAIMAATHVLVVIDSGTEALEGFAALQGALKRASRVSDFEILGVVSTRYKANTDLSRTVLESVREATQYRLYATIREATKIGAMNEQRQPLRSFARGEPAHLDFEQLAKRIDECIVGSEEIATPATASI